MPKQAARPLLRHGEFSSPSYFSRCTAERIGGGLNAETQPACRRDQRNEARDPRLSELLPSARVGRVEGGAHEHGRWGSLEWDERVLDRAPDLAARGRSEAPTHLAEGRLDAQAQ